MTLLCADDFGLTEGISEGILALCAKNRLNAVTCMTEASLLPQYAAKLLKLGSSVQIGVHFNLTHPFQRPPFSRNRLLLTPRLPAAARAEIAHRLDDQLQRFENIFKRPPDFIDGHEHVHVMPGVRPIFLAGVGRRYGALARKPWLRQVASPVLKTDTRFKAFVLNLVNAGFRRDCARLGFETNRDFGGVYSLSLAAPFESLAMGWLKSAREGTLLMFHPSAKVEPGDVISEARFREFTALSMLEQDLYPTPAVKQA
jgi:predicted glycoside hydrolase/deacetylase ChbG (UPF0249 family)